MRWWHKLTSGWSYDTHVQHALTSIIIIIAAELQVLCVTCCHTGSLQGHISRKSRKLFGPEKPLVKLRLAYSVRLIFSYVVKLIKIKITSKFRASSGLCFVDTKRIMSPEKCLKSFRTFEKQAPDVDWACKFSAPFQEALPLWLSIFLVIKKHSFLCHPISIEHLYLTADCKALKG